jgi:hypothetical protein
MRRGVVTTGLLLLLLPQMMKGDELRRIRTAVTYISGTTIYLGAGRDAGLATGDTADVWRNRLPYGKLLVLAVSASSASARALGDSLTVAVGDSVQIDKQIPGPANLPTSAAGATVASGSPSSGPRLRGSAALQFVGVTTSDAGWSYTEPSLILRLGADGLFGGGYSLSFHGRAPIGGSRERGRSPIRLYAFSLSKEGPGFGFGIGRLWSRHVSGLGTLDGGQVTFRQGNLTFGLLAGFQPEYQTSRFDETHQKFAGFLSLKIPQNGAGSGQVSFGYGQQLYKGQLDRDFLYLQTNWNAGTLFFSQSSELDLHTSVDGVTEATPSLTNTYISLSAQPLEWLGASLGYDATRPVFLIETMQAIPDSLFDSNLYQGFRAGLTFRIPGDILLLGQGTIRNDPGSSRTSRNGGGTVRFLNIAGSGVNAGANVLWNSGLYTEGEEYSVSVDRWFEGGVSVSLRGGRYRYVQKGFDDQITATTLDANITWVTPGGWYFTGSVDQTWDPLRGSTRILAELGLHF